MAPPARGALTAFDTEARSDPIENILVGERWIVRMALHGRGLAMAEDLQGDVAITRPEIGVQLPHALGLQPAALAGGDQHRTTDVARDMIEPEAANHVGFDRRMAIDQESALVQIPDAAIAHSRSKSAIGRHAARDKGRSPAIGENRNTVAVDVAALGEIGHDVPDRRLQTGLAGD